MPSLTSIPVGRPTGRGGRDNRIVGEFVLVEGSDYAERAADNQRQDQRHGTQLDGDRQAVGKKLTHSEVGHVVARAKIAMRQIV